MELLKTLACKDIIATTVKMAGLYQIDERHVEAEVAETVAGVPQHNLRTSRDIGSRTAS